MNENVTKITSPLLIVGKNSKQQLDARYGPYTSVEEAYLILGPTGFDCIFEGLTVGIIVGNNIYEYWFKNGTNLDNLVLKNTEENNLIWNN